MQTCSVMPHLSSIRLWKPLKLALMFGSGSSNTLATAHFSFQDLCGPWEVTSLRCAFFSLFLFFYFLAFLVLQTWCSVILDSWTQLHVEVVWKKKTYVVKLFIGSKPIRIQNCSFTLRSFFSVIFLKLDSAPSPRRSLIKKHSDWKISGILGISGYILQFLACFLYLYGWIFHGPGRHWTPKPYDASSWLVHWQLVVLSWDLMGVTLAIYEERKASTATGSCSFLLSFSWDRTIC